MRYSDKKPVKKGFRHWYIIAPALLLLAGGALFALEKTNVINLSSFQDRSSSTDTASPQTIPADSIDYSPATSTDNEDINNQKDSGEIANPAPTEPATVTNLTVTLTSPSKGASLDVRAIVTPLVESGTCTATVTKEGQTSLTKTAKVETQGSYSICGYLYFDASEFTELGTWNLSLVVTGANGSKGTTNTDVEITK